MRHLLHLVLVGAFSTCHLHVGDSQCDGKIDIPAHKAVLATFLQISAVRLAAAVHETLSPLLSEMKDDLAEVKTEMRESLAAVRAIEQNLKEEFKKMSDFNMAHHGCECGGSYWRLETCGQPEYDRPQH